MSMMVNKLEVEREREGEKKTARSGEKGRRGKLERVDTERG